jgi:serine protease Do
MASHHLSALPSFADLAEAVDPAVVSIQAATIEKTPAGGRRGSDPFEFFLGPRNRQRQPQQQMPDGEDQEQQQPDEFRSDAGGSGFVISSDGLIVTNNHVIEGATTVKVHLGDRDYTAEVKGADKSTDIALLKINVAGLPAVPWGDSSQLKVGEWVLAIGSPYQLNSSVTAGIISATGRAGLGFADYEDFIQTDAAINRGNSGGALINARGELVGINTGIFTEGGGYQGIGFAVPSNLAKRVVNELKANGEVRRGSIGPLTLEKLTDQLAAELGARSTNGALISRMYPNSEAYTVGLRPGDVIVAFNTQVVDDPSQFARFVADAKIGSTATVRVLRENRSLEFKLPIVSTSSQRPRR